VEVGLEGLPVLTVPLFQLVERVGIRLGVLVMLWMLWVLLGFSVSVTGQTVVVTMISVVTMGVWLAGQLVTVEWQEVMVRVVVVVMVLVVHLVVDSEVLVEHSSSSLDVEVAGAFVVEDTGASVVLEVTGALVEVSVLEDTGALEVELGVAVAVAVYVMHEQAELRAWTSQLLKSVGTADAAVVVPASHVGQYLTASAAKRSSIRLR
jgi:hypothetical protein